MEKTSMEKTSIFERREHFREWLDQNGATSGGVWLLFGKPGGPVTLSHEEALLEALCFGWIDGQMQKIDEKTYSVYFAPRRKGSVWSEKNRGLTEMLEAEGRMTEAGRAAILTAKETGTWDTPKAPPISEEQIALLAAALEGCEPAYSNFQKMSPSVRRTYAAHYLDAKTEDGRARRLEKIIGRLKENLKPM